jgi:uncharacterized membrane protein
MTFDVSAGARDGMRDEVNALAPAAPQATVPVVVPAAVRAARTLTLAATLGLIVLGLAWELWLAPTGRGTLAVKVVPLVFALPGLLRHRMYTFRWLSLLVWLYVLEGLVRAPSDRGLSAVLAGIEVALAVLIFSAATFYIRRRLAGAKPAPPHATGTAP